MPAKKNKGYYEGLYENGDGPIKEFTANNNGIMMEALLFKKRGQIAALQQQRSAQGQLCALYVGETAG
ncbi:DUF3131 domain-containing protein [Pantoea tagorei]